MKKLTLNVAQPLAMVDPVLQKAASSPEEFKPELVAHRDLELVVQTTRELLWDTMSSRFYAKYASVGRSYAIDISLFFHPAMKKLLHLQALVDHFDGSREKPGYEKTSAEAVRTKVWEIVHERCVAILRKQHELAKSAPAGTAAQVQEAELKQISIAKKDLKRTLAVMKDCAELFEDEEEDDANGANDAEGNLEENFSAIAWAEIEAYKSLKVLVQQFSDDDVLPFWEKATHLPTLRIVAAMSNSFNCSAGGIECDFGVCGQVMSPTRANLDAVVFEMCCTLRRNFDSIPPMTDVTTWARRDMKKRLLQYKFRGVNKFVDLVDGMAADINAEDQEEEENYDAEANA
jgi:hypothetical protein